MINTKELKEIVKRASKFIPKKAIQPVLECCLLEIKDGELTITTTNLNETYRNSMQADNGDVSISICINCKQLLKTLDAIDGDIKISQAQYNLEIHNEMFSTILAGIESTEFPKIDILEGIYIETINTADFKKLAKGCACYDTNKILSCVNYNSELKKYAAINGNVLFMLETELEWVNTLNFELNIPACVINKLQSKEYDLNVFHAINDAPYIIFKNGNETIKTQCMEGIYPKYEQFIPYNNEKFIEISKKELSKVLKLLSSTLNRTNTIEFDFIKNKVSSSSPDIGTTTVNFSVKNKKIKNMDVMGLNWYYLKQVADFADKNIIFKMDNNLSGILYDFGNKFHALVMPVQLN